MACDDSLAIYYRFTLLKYPNCPYRPAVKTSTTPTTPTAPPTGDVLLHTITDALLGALCLPDIGQLFPDTDPKWKGARSDIFLGEAVSQWGGRGGGLRHVL